MANVAYLSPEDFPGYVREFEAELLQAQFAFATAIDDGDFPAARAALHLLRNTGLAMGCDNLVAAADLIRTDHTQTPTDLRLVDRYAAVTRSSLRAVEAFAANTAVLARYND